MSKPFANVPAIDHIAKEGWAYVATDYVGLGTRGGHAYLIGDDAARNVLDAVQAARTLPGAKLDTSVVVWGHSQGGNTALWTGIRSTEHASSLKVLGIAALAPATDLQSLIEKARGTTFGKIVSAYLLHAYGTTYPDVDVSNYVHWRAKALVSDIASRCVGGWQTLFSVVETQLLPGDGIFSRSPVSGTLGLRLLENTPRAQIAMPVLIAQGQADDLVSPEVQQRYVAARCAAGQRIDYRVYPGLDHISLVAENFPLSADLIQWTRERFAGRPDSNNCPP
jgi:alpha-beta hydrolase superfamily lysophospholipase